MVTPIRDILRTVARTRGLERAAHLQQVQAVWGQVVGEILAAVSAPVALRGHRLVVGVLHHTAAHEVRLRQVAIVEALAGIVGKGVVADVVPVVRRRLPGRPGRRRG